MDARHKKILQSRRSFLVLELDPSLLYDKLISTGIFNQDMIEEIKSAGPRRDQARQLVIDLETRGSRAFPAFLECLVETGQSHVADLLSADLGIQPPRSLPIRPIPIPIPIPTSRNHGTQLCIPIPIPIHIPIPIYIPIHIPIMEPKKEMDKPDRGHISRKDEGVAYSPEKSPDRPIQYQKDTGFEVCPDEFEPAASGIDNHTDAMPMSPREELGKYSDELDASGSLPTPSDILVSYSTFPGYVSWRDTQAGSWYVETLDNVLEEFAGYEDLLTLLTMVTDKVSQISAKGIFKQMPGSFNFLRKRIFFQVNCLNDK
ncbi:CASP9 protein, partial [Polyodon spathula]|nr:CASP9 protein [Polyodon spathula]